MPGQLSADKKKLLLKLGMVALVLLVAVLTGLRGVDWPQLIEAVMAPVKRAGPWAFFSTMAIFPAAGVPMMVFTLTAGSAFGDRMGMGGVVAACIVATTVNLALTYWLARWGLRPWLERVMGRLGYRLPEVETGDAADLIVLLRMTPGVPFFVQNYLLGLADAPVVRYFVLSCILTWPNTAAFTLFGDALLHGRGRLVLVSIGALAALAAATHMARRHMKTRAHVQPARPI